MKKQMLAKIMLVAFVVMLIGTSVVNNNFAVTYGESVYQAENATLNGVSTNTNHSGYTGSGFVEGFETEDDYVQFSVSVTNSADYSLKLRYANDTSYSASRKIYVDNNLIATAVFPDLANWDTWALSEVGTFLSAGSHTVKISFNNHAINLDNLTIEEKHESTRSLYLSNWSNMMGIWKSAKLCTEDNSSKGPRLDELRYSSAWNVNQIKDYSGFFRNETDSIKYTDGSKFESEGYFDETGILHSNYLKYNSSYPSNLEISRDYAMVPNQNFIVARYSIKNTSSTSKTYKILDMLHVNNTSTGNISASYNSSKQALIVDMTSSGQPLLALGAFDTPTAYQTGNDTVSDISQAACSPWNTFDNDGTLKNNASVSCQDISVAFSQSVTVSGGATQNVYFYIALGTSSANINSIIDTVRAQSGTYWFTNTNSSYQTWFSSAKTVPDFQDNDLELVYKRNVVMIKNSLRPGTSTGDGACPATTNPYDYGYKVWTRDAATTAVAMDAAGFATEGERYWRWLAARQLTGTDAGKFNTCIDLWTNQRSEFIEPEHDILGWFLYGVYRHCVELNNFTLRDDLWNQLKATADYIMNNIDTNGFGPADFSIWEDMDNYGIYTYTQALYVGGLEAAAKMAKGKGLQSLADSYNGAASTIKTAINRDDTNSIGLWNWSNGYYDRNIRYDGSLNTLEDTSAMIMFVLGVVDINSSRTSSTISRFEEDLSSDTYGLARFGNDTYYSSDSYYSPSGDEALEVAPSWPQMSCWNSVSQKYMSNSTKSLNILDWYKHRTAAGFMVTGEAVSDVTEKPCVSTSSEPVTAGAYVLACLTYAGIIDLRIIPDQSNAGCYKNLTINSGCLDDWAQYSNVPYYLDNRNDSPDNDTSLKNVYVTNDGTNLYLRVDNESGSLPSFNDPNKLFQVSVYCEDFNNTDPTSVYSINGTNIVRNMAYCYKRDSDSNNFQKFTVSSGNWAYNKNLTSGQFEWQTSTGRLEMKIPLSEISSSTPGQNAWFNAVVVISKKVGAAWTDMDTFTIHYRVTGQNQSWIYGDFE